MMRLGPLLCVALLLSLAQLQRAQNCSSPQIDLFTARLDVSRNSVTTRSISVAMLAFGITAPLPPTQQAIFAALIQAFQLNPAEESFYNFAKAMDDISDSYFRACWGPVDELVSGTQFDVSSLVSETIILVNRNQSSDAPQIRENLGKFFCIADNYTSPSISAQIIVFFSSINMNLLQPTFGLGRLVTKINLPAIIGYTEIISNGDLVPTSDLPLACTTGIVVVQTLDNSKVDTISLEREGGIAVSSNDIVQCNDIRLSDLWFPGVSVSYYIANYSSIAVPTSLSFTFPAPSPSLSPYPYDVISVNPGLASLARVEVHYNETNGPYLRVTGNVVTQGSSIGASFSEASSVVVGPGERVAYFLSISSTGGLAVGSDASISVNVSENCTDQTFLVTLPVRVYIPVPLTATRTNSSVTIQWTSVAMASMNYRLHIDLANGTDWFVSVGLTTTSYTVSSLNLDQPVYVTMTAFDNSGIIARTGAVQFRTLEGVPGPVSNLRYFSLSSTETRVSWAPPMTPNGVILSYSLTVTDLNGNLVQDSIINVSPTADDISLIVSGLTPLTRYNVVIVANTSAGAGASATIPMYSVEGVPLQGPRNVTVQILNTTSARVSWDPPLEVDRRGIIRTYTVRIAYPNVVVTFTTSQTWLVVTGLLHKTTIVVTVTASTSVGTSPFSLPTAQIVELPPSAPRELSGSYAGFTAITLSWRVPEMSYGGIVAYRIIYQPTSSGSQSTTRRVLASSLDNAESPSVSIGRLDLFSEYSFIVQANTSAGYGPISSTTVHMAIFTGGIIGGAGLLVLLMFIVLIIVLAVCIRGCIKRKPQEKPKPRPSGPNIADVQQRLSTDIYEVKKVKKERPRRPSIANSDIMIPMAAMEEGKAPVVTEKESNVYENMETNETVETKENVEKTTEGPAINVEVEEQTSADPQDKISELPAEKEPLSESPAEKEEPLSESPAEKEEPLSETPAEKPSRPTSVVSDEAPVKRRSRDLANVFESKPKEDEPPTKSTSNTSIRRTSSIMAQRFESMLKEKDEQKNIARPSRKSFTDLP